MGRQLRFEVLGQIAEVYDIEDLDALVALLLVIQGKT
jgi:hypothetical protein